MTLTFHFCARCGTYIYKETDAEEQKDIVIVTAGTLDEDGTKFTLENMKIQKEFYIKDRVSWMKPIEGAEQCQVFV